MPGLGKLHEKLLRYKEISPELKKRIGKAIELRNFIIHQFWRKNLIRYSTPEGRLAMIAELQRYEDEFERLTDDISTLCSTLFYSLGFSKEESEKSLNDFMSAAGLVPFESE